MSRLFTTNDGVVGQNDSAWEGVLLIWMVAGQGAGLSGCMDSFSSSTISFSLYGRRQNEILSQRAVKLKMSDQPKSDL